MGDSAQDLVIPEARTPSAIQTALIRYWAMTGMTIAPTPVPAITKANASPRRLVNQVETARQEPICPHALPTTPSKNKNLIKVNETRCERSQRSIRGSEHDQRGQEHPACP